jgi:response regulator RpfG family c-di-GMP phosphodiesterase
MGAKMSDRAPKVLVVDDDAAFAQMTAEVLTEAGYEVTTCLDPREALDQAGRTPFSAAVIDLVMPRMGGLELVRQLHLLSPLTQAVILTGRGDMSSAIDGIRSGVFDYLRKDELQIAGLRKALQRAVERAELLGRNEELVRALHGSNQLLRALHESSATILAERHVDRLLERILGSVRETCGAAAARALIFERTHTDEILVSLAVGDGADTLRGMRLRPETGLAVAAALEDRVVAVASASADARFFARCDALGSDAWPLVAAPMRHAGVLGALLAGGRPGAFSPDEVAVLAALGRQSAIAISNAWAQERADNFFVHTSDMLVEFLEAMDVEYPNHSRGVAVLSDMLTRRLGLPEPERRAIHFGALLHDIGKVRLPPELLRRKPETEADLALVRQHPALGLEVLRPISAFEEMLPIVLAHHERWDGGGYPRGLKGEDIPLGARVVALAEVFDVMSRPGRCRHPDGPVAEIEANGGTQFDPRLARSFAAGLREQGDPRSAA